MDNKSDSRDVGGESGVGGGSGGSSVPRPLASPEQNGFYIHCCCGVVFLRVGDYVKHKKEGGEACSDGPVLSLSANSSGNPFSRSVITSDRQLAAFFGDLDHKREVVSKYKILGDDVTSFFDGKHQAWYVKTYFPDLVVRQPGAQPPSDRTVSTIFEFYFHTSVTFRFAYLRWLPGVLTRAPVVSSPEEVLRGNVPVFDNEEIFDSFSKIDTRAVAPLTSESPLGMVGISHSGESYPDDRPFTFPRDQINPYRSADVPGSADHVYGWANAERVWRHYPELMGYNRQEAFRTPGDVYPWLVSSRTESDGYGFVRVDFPSDRSPFDNEENGNLGQLDGLSHWQNINEINGFEVSLSCLSSAARFSEKRYLDKYCRRAVPMGGGRMPDSTYVRYRGTPGRRHYFVLQRFVVWKQPMSHAPRPDSPGPGEHVEL